jgi:hypothetical protein
VRGLLRGLQRGATEIGKRGLRAAQAGLQQLEAALDDGHGGHNAHGHGGPSSSPYPPDNTADHSGPPPPAEQVLSIAIHISELPTGRRQQEALARLPRALRERVEAVLREQALAGGGGGDGYGASTYAGSNGSGGVIHTAEFNLDGEFGDERMAAALAAEGPAGPAPASRLGGAAGPKAAAGAAAAVAATAAAAGTANKAPKAATTPAAAAKPAAGAAKAAAPAPPPRAPPPAAAASGDLLGLHDDHHHHAPAANNSHPNIVDVADAQDFFSGGGSGAGAGSGGGTAAGTGAAAAAAALDELLSPAGGAAASAVASVTSHNEPPPDPNEPEHRRLLRERRLAEREEKMRAALAAKQGADGAEAARREAQQRHKQQHAPRVEAWRARNKGNLRGLLASLQTVLWEGSGWVPVGMGDLLDPSQVRKTWMKANLVVHPDKVRQKKGSDEQVAISDLVFDALKEGMAAFQG